MSDNRLNKSRLGRAGRLGGMAAGAAARQLGTRAANTMRSDEEAEEAIGRQALETADRIVKVLGGMKGAAMKVGQTLSVLDPGMVPGPYRDEFQAKLAQLQAMAPTVSFKDMRKVIEQDLGEPLTAAFEDFDPEAVAAASIGQVYRATLHDGRAVAVKVQYPGIKDVVRADLKNLGMLLRLAARFAPGLDTKEIAEEITERITEELDYELEAMNHRALAREYRDHPFIVVPPVITELCRERVIVTEFIEGRNFADDPHRHGRGTVAVGRDPVPLLRQRAVPPPAAERRPPPGQLAVHGRRPSRVHRLRVLQAPDARGRRRPARDPEGLLRPGRRAPVRADRRAGDHLQAPARHGRAADGEVPRRDVVVPRGP